MVSKLEGHNVSLPDGWTIANMPEIVRWGSGGTPKADCAEYYNGSIPWIIIGDMNDGLVTTSEKTISETGLKESSAKYVEIGSVLLAMYGSIGKLGIAGIRLTTNQAIAFTQELNGITNKYLFYYLYMQKDKLMSMGKGGTQKNISQTVINTLTVPLPPLAEQHRIVTKVDALFSKLDKGVETLQTIKQQLRTYRQAVLKWAFEGKLTNHNSENWRIATLGEICKISSGGTPSRKNKRYYSGNIPWIKTGEINWNFIYNSDEHITAEAIQNSSAKYFPIGTILVAMYGQGLTRGRAAILGIKATTNQAVCALIPSEHLYNLFLFYFFKNNYWSIREKAIGGNQLNLSATLISNVKIFLPPKKEQLAIVTAIESRLSVCDKLEQIVDENLAKAAVLRQSILKKAFEGRLVPQDPNDEPADKLLERIKDMKTAVLPKVKATKRKKNA